MGSGAWNARAENRDLGAAAISIAYAFVLTGWIKKQSDGDDTMRKLAKAVQDGAMAFLKTEYSILSGFVIVVAALLFFALPAGDTSLGQNTAIAFVLGALLSGIAGWVGMRTATQSAVRTTEAAKSSLAAGLTVAFRSGSVMGMTVVGLGLAGICALYIMHAPAADAEVIRNYIEPIFGFSFGASSIALFARVGGGIFTKAADVGADLVGKVEAGIPEDDPRNPATIADNVGDNVGDVAGMGADLFESYAGSIIASMAIAFSITVAGAEVPFADRLPMIVLPLVLAGIGIIASLIGTFAVRTSDEAHIHHALFRGLMVASVVFAVGAAAVFAVRLASSGASSERASASTVSAASARCCALATADRCTGREPTVAARKTNSSLSLLQPMKARCWWAPPRATAAMCRRGWSGLQKTAQCNGPMRMAVAVTTRRTR